MRFAYLDPVYLESRAARLARSERVDAWCRAVALLILAGETVGAILLIHRLTKGPTP